jgi:hypothetical protein
MKIICFTLLFLPLFIFGQNPKYGCLNISSPSGETFFLYINNVKINETPQVKVRVEKMYKYSYDVKIEFADASHLIANRNKLFICNKSGIFRDFYYDIVKDTLILLLKTFDYTCNPLGNYKCLKLLQYLV